MNLSATDWYIDSLFTRTSSLSLLSSGGTMIPMCSVFHLRVCKFSTKLITASVGHEWPKSTVAQAPKCRKSRLLLAMPVRKKQMHRPGALQHSVTGIYQFLHSVISLQNHVYHGLLGTTCTMSS